MTIWTDLQGTAFAQTFHQVGDIRTRCLEAGSGQPLIFLHGTGGHAEAYARNLAAHAEHFHVYAIDMVGHGYSSRPDTDYSIDTFVDHVVAFIDYLGVDKVMLSGESLGAFVASWVTLRRPEKIDRLVLNTGLPIVPSEPGRQELLKGMAISNAAAADLTHEIVRQRLGFLMLNPDQSVTDELVEVRYQIYDQPGMQAIVGRIATSVLGTITDLAHADGLFKPEKLQQITCPTLVLWTQNNPGQHLDVAYQGMEQLPNARLEIMQQSAHWPQWEEPELFDQIHLEFLLSNGPA